MLNIKLIFMKMFAIIKLAVRTNCLRVFLYKQSKKSKKVFIKNVGLPIRQKKLRFKFYVLKDIVNT